MEEQNINEQINNVKTIWNTVKNCFSLIRKKEYPGAIKEVFVLLKLLYGKLLKGKYANIHGVKVSYTTITIVAVILGWMVLPDEKNTPKIEDIQEEISQDNNNKNTYDKNGVKVYSLQKCNDGNAVCGLLENGNDNDIAYIGITISFYNNDGDAVYEGKAEADGVKSMSRIKFNIPSAQPFDYFMLSQVIVK